MKKRFIAYFLVIALITFINMATGSILGFFHRAEPVSLPARNYAAKLVLLPLDSRPACTQFVEQLARLANIEVILPPAEYLDNYTTPGKRHELANWLQQAVRQADAAIVSTDMLLSGGLLASRSNIADPSEVAAVAELLTAIKRENPRLCLYTFHIIPRLLIADHTPDKQFQKAMQKYSMLYDQVLLFDNPLDSKRLIELSESLPSRVIENHKLLYERNETVNNVWISLAKAGILDALVIGQDDGFPFGLPNITKQRLTAAVERQNLSDRVIITRGTDEVAVTLLGRLALQSKRQIKVYVEYSVPDAPQVVMPFMPNSVATTVTEKLRIINAKQVNSPTEADFILFVHIGKRNNSTYSLTTAAKRLKDYVEQGRDVALVDLTENFYASQTLLPYAVKAEVALNKLAAYAGWNTTSNSVGTAVVQAALYSAYKSNSQTVDLRLYHDNLTFLIARLLDDWHYLKEIQPEINQKILAAGADPYRLHDRKQHVEQIIRRRMAERTYRLLHSVKTPVTLTGQEQPLYIQQIKTTLTLPWERTFEIKLDPAIDLIQLSPKK